MKQVLAGILSALCLLPATAFADGIALFGGRMTDNQWEEALVLWEADWLDSGLIGIAASHQVARRGRFALEVEGQVVKHFGDQTNWEVNAPVVGRVDVDRGWWRSAAFGIGLSWASEPPRTEIARDGASQRWLIYWMGEVAFGKPEGAVEYVARIHHRSDGYGVFETDAGSNALVVGVRWGW